MFQKQLQQINLKIASPLDQFGADDDSGYIETKLEAFINQAGFLRDSLDYLGFFDISDLAGMVYGIMSYLTTLIMDDEESDEDVWEEGVGLNSSLQASLFSTNLLGMIPGTETTTSEASFTFLLSISTLITISIMGFALHGFRYFAVLYPAGTPTAMAPFIIVIELISYIARAVSLGMRLFANMFAGHSLVKILIAFLWLFISSSTPFFGIPVFGLLILIIGLEVGIAYLQAYVFVTLTGMYVESALAGGH